MAGNNASQSSNTESTTSYLCLRNIPMALGDPEYVFLIARIEQSETNIDGAKQNRQPKTLKHNQHPYDPQKDGESDWSELYKYNINMYIYIYGNWSKFITIIYYLSYISI